MNFKIIAEGNTDYRVLKTIIQAIYPTSNVDVLVPTVDALSHKTIGHAGWENVAKYLQSDLFEDAVVNTDFLIIQIDTDVCEHPNFGVTPITLADHNEIEFYELIKLKLIQWIDTYELNTFTYYQDKIIFAICIHSLECWLLAHYVPQNELKLKKIKNGLDNLKRALNRNSINLIEPKDPNQYEVICKNFRKIKKHNIAREYSFSLDKFICQLESILK